MSAPLYRYPHRAQRLLTAMSRTRSGWSAQHVDTLLTGFGFTKRDSGAHTFYRHGRYPDLALAVPRHRQLRAYLITEAVRLVGRLLAYDSQEMS